MELIKCPRKVLDLAEVLVSSSSSIDFSYDDCFVGPPKIPHFTGNRLPVVYFDRVDRIFFFSSLKEMQILKLMTSIYTVGKDYVTIEV